MRRAGRVRRVRRVGRVGRVRRVRHVKQDWNQSEVPTEKNGQKTNLHGHK